MDPLREGARSVAATLKSAGFEVYLAGGSVRDLIRGEAPTDYDLVTNARPEEVTRLFKRTVQVGAAFGVVRVLLGKGLEYEVSTYRTDRDYTDGRRPDQVVYAKTKEEDVVRRDFTINALLMDLDSGEVIDLIGGREDLKRGIIRAIGDPAARFGEDRLRMLRAVRFAARFGFTIEPATLRSIEVHAAAIDAVSVERIVVELEGIWASPRPAHGFSLLVSTGLDLGALPLLAKAGEPAKHTAADRLERLVEAARALDEDARLHLAWALLLDAAGIRAGEVEDPLRALKLSRSAIRTIRRVVEKRGLLLEPDRASLADRTRILIDPDAPLFRAFAHAVAGPGSAAVGRWTSEAVALSQKPLPPLPLVSGRDLEALGLRPGPRFKAILDAVETEALERRIGSREDALSFVRARYLPSAPT